MRYFRDWGMFQQNGTGLEQRLEQKVEQDFETGEEDLHTFPGRGGTETKNGTDNKDDFVLGKVDPNSLLLEPYAKAATVKVIFQADENLAWSDREMHFHKGDIAYIPPVWVSMLLGRGIIRRVNQ